MACMRGLQRDATVLAACVCPNTTSTEILCEHLRLSFAFTRTSPFSVWLVDVNALSSLSSWQALSDLAAHARCSTITYGLFPRVDTVKAAADVI